MTILKAANTAEKKRKVDKKEQDEAICNGEIFCPSVEDALAKLNASSLDLAAGQAEKYLKVYGYDEVAKKVSGYEYEPCLALSQRSVFHKQVRRIAQTAITNVN
jgi:hypothetical protein